jgi:hypothetical protein
MKTHNTDSTPALDAEEQQLRELAAAADEGKQIEIPDNDADERGAREPESDGTDGSDPSNDAGTAEDSQKKSEGQKPEAKANEEKAKGDADKTKADDKAKSDPKESAYAKLQKEQERLARNRREFEEEKAKIRAELEAERHQLRQQTRTKPEAAQLDDPLAKYSPEDLDKAAERFEAAGKYDLAQDARQAAKDKRAAAATQAQREAKGEQQQPAKPDAQQGPTPEFMAQWKAHLERETEANPDLKDKESALYKATAGLLAKEPWLSRMPDGISKAVQVAKLQAEASAVPGLKQQIATMQKELDELRAATSPAAGRAESRGRTQIPVDEMSDDEAEAELRRLASEADRLVPA